MSLVSFLLRVLLSITLVANGAGYAQASTRMQLEHAAHLVRAQPVPAAVPVAAQDAGPAACHREQVGPTAGTHAVAASDVSKPPHAAAGSGKSSADCCEGKTCNCECAHAQCATTVAFQASRVAEREGRVPALAIDRPHPRLPQLIRPPIG